MIKALIFDLGGVLIDLDAAKCKEAFKNLLGYGRIDELLDLCHQKGIYSDLEEGKLSEDEFRTLILSESRKDAVPENVDISMGELLRGIEPYKVEMLKRLAVKYELYMLSNNNGISMKKSEKIFHDAGIPMDSIFRKRFLSYQMKLLKPSPFIYRTALADIGRKASEVLFVDDSAANVEAAKSVGMNALHYVQGTDLEAALKSVLGDF